MINKFFDFLNDLVSSDRLGFAVLLAVLFIFVFFVIRVVGLLT